MNKYEMEMKAREHDLSDLNQEVVAEAVEAMGQGAVSGYKKIENTVVGGYKKIENGAVEGFGKVVDKCVEVLFAREGESVEDAKDRLAGKGKE